MSLYSLMTTAPVSQASGRARVVLPAYLRPSMVMASGPAGRIPDAAFTARLPHPRPGLR